MLCDALSPFVPTVTQPTFVPIPVCICVELVCVCVCVSTPHPSLRQCWLGSSNGNVCATTTHKNTHRHKQTLSLLWAPRLDFAYSPGSSLFLSL